MAGAYAVALIVTIYFTHPTARRAVGAAAGGVVVALMVLGMIALCERLGWWRIPSNNTPYFLPLMFLGLAVSCAPIYLITWRVARRFGWRGIAASIAIVAVIGPPRDYLYARTFPQWMVFAPGIAPILADAATYVAIVAVGHAVMRLIAGPSATPLTGARTPSS